LDKFTVVGYSIGGKEDDQGITITGYRLTDRGKTFTFNSPFERFEQSDESQYKYMEDLQDVVADIEEEVLQYLKKDKRAPDPQREINFPDQGEASPEEKLQTNKAKNRIKDADTEAQDRVREMDEEDDENAPLGDNDLIDKSKGKHKAGKKTGKGSTRKKRSSK